uniref:SRR1-like domain-containing protein n=1 Tax=Ananas comosus var. bracteatus TaxID=296719 RepID=A0A6V7PDD0_ANACO|nr:unnamed protein product [Ananas comosus var. bracteatus]
MGPIDPVVDHARVSKLRERMESSIRRLESSRFYRRFLSRLRGRQIQRALASVSPSSGSSIRMVVYGVGSIESYEPPRLQLALALLLRRELGPAAASLEVFDPVLSATECAAAAALGCAVIAVDERGGGRWRSRRCSTCRTARRRSTTAFSRPIGARRR